MKKNVLILFGGRSVEHEVSVRSARNIVEAIDKQKYNVLLVGIDQQGAWLPCTIQRLLDDSKATVAAIADNAATIGHVVSNTVQGTLQLHVGADAQHVDVVFPVLHGPLGEDGTLQGLLTLADVPFVGADVLGSAIGMDKDITKRLLHEAGLPIVQYQVGHSHKRRDLQFGAVAARFGVPFFVKPANAGSSVGVSKVCKEEEFAAALDEAFRYDAKILLEKYIPGREVECAVLGNDEPIASVPGDIMVQADFYSYDAKYISDDGATLAIPTQLPTKSAEQVRQLALRAFQVLCCQGMARVDFFATEDGELYINEVNTIPGFTSISMYPKLWEYSGIPYPKLIDTLLRLAVERFERQQSRATSRFRQK